MDSDRIEAPASPQSGMTRRQFVGSVAAAGLAAASAPRARAQAPAASGVPGVLLILTDDQSWHLGCLGTRGIRTPHADALAAAGVLFRNAFATCSSCSPSRSAILTGMFPHANGHWRNTVGPAVPEPESQFSRQGTKVDPVGVHEDIPTLVEILDRAGVETGITQKFHLSPPWKYRFRQRLGAGSDPDSHLRAMRTFLAACHDRPFFMMANIGNTHRPFAPHIVPIDSPRVDPRGIDVPPELPDTPALRHDLAQYLDAVQCADACAGAVLQALREAGRLEHTLVIFTSDQGYCYHRAKATAYDDGVRVPLIVAGPGVRSGAQESRLASHVDLLPTILEAVGLPIPERVQGASLMPLLAGREVPSWRGCVFAEHNAHGPNPREYYPIRSACDGRFHYLRNLTAERRADIPVEAMALGRAGGMDVFWAGPADIFPGGPWGNGSFRATVEAKEAFPKQYELLVRTFARPPEELYDLHSDPGEMENLAGDPRFAAVQRRLAAALDAWMQGTDDPGIALRERPRREQA